MLKRASLNKKFSGYNVKIAAVPNDILKMLPAFNLNHGDEAAKSLFYLSPAAREYNFNRLSPDLGLSDLKLEDLNKMYGRGVEGVKSLAGFVPKTEIENIIGEEAAAGLGSIGRLSGAGLGAGLGALGLSNIKALQRQDPGMLARLMGAKSRRGLSKNQLRALGAAMGGAAGGYLS